MPSLWLHSSGWTPTPNLRVLSLWPAWDVALSYTVPHYLGPQAQQTPVCLRALALAILHVKALLSGSQCHLWLQQWWSGRWPEVPILQYTLG